ncbi:restriction endonuclease subunit S [Streptomyces sp. Tue6028]|uniref:restriction endonuclease subunit S n=1 Tax=Streptomyces sp. Tue6028 TaxID=2036037 RepID=UPI003D74ACB0
MTELTSSVAANLPELPAGWSYVSLEDLLEPNGISYGIVQPGNHDQTGIPIVRVKDLKAGKVNQDDPLRVSSEVEEKYSRTRLKGGEVLLSLVGSVGETSVATSELSGWNVARAIGVLRVSDLISASWLKICISGDVAQHYMQTRLNTTVQATLNLRDVRKIPIVMPPNREREAVAGVIEALDGKVAINERIASTARELGMTLIAQAIKGDDLVEVAVESVTIALTRGVAPKYTDSPDGITVLNQKCIRGGRVNLEPSRMTLREKVKAPKLLQRNDVLVNSTGVGTLGRVARWTAALEATVDSHVTIVRFDEQRVDPVCAGFAMLRAQPRIEAMGEGSTGQTELRRAQVGGLEITLPSPARQKELRIKLEALEERADRAFSESLALAALRDTLLPQLMSGKLRVREAERIVEDAV